MAFQRADPSYEYEEELTSHEFYNPMWWMLNPDEEGHAPPPAPLLGAFLDAPRRALRARDGLDPNVFGMAKLPSELQRRIKKLAGFRSLALKEECQPTCVGRVVNDDDPGVMRFYDGFTQPFDEQIWRDQQGSSGDPSGAIRPGSFYSAYMGATCSYSAYTGELCVEFDCSYWERLDDPLLSHSHALAGRVALPSIRKAGGARATRAKRGARRPRNESIGCDLYWLRADYFWLGAMAPRSMAPSKPIAPHRQPATDGKLAAYPNSWFYNRRSSSPRPSASHGSDARFSTRVPERVLYNCDSSNNKRAEAKKRRVLRLAQQAACLAACLAIQRKAERAHLAAFRRAAKAGRHKVNCAILRGSRSGGGGYGNLYEILTLA